VDNKANWKSFIMYVKLGITAQGEASTVMCPSTFQLGLQFSYYTTVKAIPLYSFSWFCVSSFTFILIGLQRCEIKLKGYIPNAHCIFIA